MTTKAKVNQNDEPLTRLVIPEKFNRNHPTVRAMGSPADTGLRLLVCQRIGISILAGLEMLDLGCGSRFADAIINHNVPLKSYVGIDVYKEIIHFLAENTKDDPRLEFFHIDARNPTYNKGGVPLSVNTVLPIAGRTFDILCMYSVITHQLPDDAALIFTLLRRHVKDKAPQNLLFAPLQIPRSRPVLPQSRMFSLRLAVGGTVRVIIHCNRLPQ